MHGHGLPTPTSGPMHSLVQCISAYTELNIGNPHVLDALRYACGFGCCWYDIFECGFGRFQTLNKGIGVSSFDLTHIAA